MHYRAIHAVVGALVIGAGCVAWGQSLSGDWVEEAEEGIEAHRKTDLRVIVLDEGGEPAAGAAVDIEQLEHAFAVGWTLHEPAWPAELADGEPVWRAFNTVSLDRLVSWPELAEDAGSWALPEGVEGVIERADEAGMAVRWGGLISADSGRNPAWAMELEGEALAEAVEQHIGQVLAGHGGRVTTFDVYTHVADHDVLERRLGPAMVRRIYELARARRPGARLAIRFDDRLLGTGARQVAELVRERREQFVPIDEVVIHQRTREAVLQASVARSLGWLEGMEARVAIAGLEVGGASEAMAQLNLETLLRTLFASPQVDGIWFGAVRREDEAVPYAGLVNNDGEPTAAGRVVEGLFRDQWWTRLREQTDELGNVRARVFAGRYRVRAELADGREASMEIHVPLAEHERIVLLEPMEE